MSVTFTFLIVKFSSKFWYTLYLALSGVKIFIEVSQFHIARLAATYTIQLF